MKKALRARKSQRGQATTEMILMMVVFLGIVSFVTATFQNSNLIAKVVSGPWKKIAGMAQNGVWEDPDKGMALHPNARDRWSTPEGENPQ